MSRSLNFILGLALVLPALLLAAPALADELAGPPKPASPVADASALEAELPDPVLDAMEREVSRLMEGFSGGSRDAPYYMAVRLFDLEDWSAAASRGAPVNEGWTRMRVAHVEVRVGSYLLDNTHELRGMADPGISAAGTIPVDAEPGVLRHMLWSLAERAYSVALTRHSLVLANTNVRVDEEVLAGDFSPGPALRWRQADSPEPVDTRAWSARLLEISKAGLTRDRVENSIASVESSRGTLRFVDSEGAAIRQVRQHARFAAMASARADDGMMLDKFASVDALNLAGLDRQLMDAAMDEVLTDVENLMDAPVVDPVNVPAILRGRAAGVFFHEVFGHRIEGHRQKLSDEGQTFAEKVGEAVTAPFLSVYDDPSLAEFNGTVLNGFYRYDDEGLAARRVELVNDGVLEGFLLSRSPIPGFTESNGHGRAQPGFDPVSRQGNLVVEAGESVSYEALRAQLIEEIEAQGKPYGLIFDDIQGGYTNTVRWAAQSFKVLPVMVYRVYTDGRPDELVRGADLVGTPLQAFEKIIAAADDPAIFNGVCGAESGWVPVSAVAPSLLLSSIEVEKRYKSQDRPPILPPPGPSPVGVGGGS